MIDRIPMQTVFFSTGWGTFNVIGVMQDFNFETIRNFVRLVLVSIVIAVPITWWAMTKWLQDFAYHIDLQWWMFLAEGLIAVLIAVVTVSFQAVRAALENPVKNLRAE